MTLSFQEGSAAPGLCSKPLNIFRASSLLAQEANHADRYMETAGSIGRRGQERLIQNTSCMPESHGNLIRELRQSRNTPTEVISLKLGKPPAAIAARRRRITQS
jgi:hypothetical protein